MYCVWPKAHYDFSKYRRAYRPSTAFTQDRIRMVYYVHFTQYTYMTRSGVFDFSCLDSRPLEQEYAGRYFFQTRNIYNNETFI